MIKEKKVLALIPARGGSKRLPRKNVLALKGKPLIAWTIEAAQKSKFIDAVIVSTDDKEISQVALECGAGIPFTRPAKLASDTATSNDTIVHAISSMEGEFEIIVVLQPTSPFRTDKDIDACLEMLIERKGQGVVSVTECEHNPLWSNVLPVDGNMKGFLSKMAKRKAQDLESHYRLNGAVYCFLTKKIIEENGVFYNEKVYAYVMPQRFSVDIDTSLDFEFAELIAAKNI